MKTDIKATDLKRYHRSEFNLGCYNELRGKIIPLIKQAIPISEIIKDFSLKTEQIGFLIKYQDKKTKFVQILGSKTESYYSEDEMMKPISYSYDDLSPDEKLIYNEKYD